VGRRKFNLRSIGIYKFKNAITDKIAGIIPETGQPAHWIELN
jgi:hypothetical protein